MIKHGYSADIKLLKITIPNIDELRSWCHSLIPKMRCSYSQYARDRAEIWLFHDVNLASGKVNLGYSNPRIFQFCQLIYPGCNIGLLTFGGTKFGVSSTGLITPHRDHTFAMPIARSVNLGEAIFGYGDDEHKQYLLNDGNVIEFNCKVLHSVSQIVSSERFSLNLWQLNQAKGYQSLL